MPCAANVGCDRAKTCRFAWICPRRTADRHEGTNATTTQSLVSRLARRSRQSQRALLSNSPAGSDPFGSLAEPAPCRVAAPVPAHRARCLDREHGRAPAHAELEAWAQASACPSGRHACRLDLAHLPNRFLEASHLVFTTFSRPAGLNLSRFFPCRTMRSRAVGFQGRARSRPKPAGTQIRAAGLTPASLIQSSRILM
jgi:hypothetical protein